MKRIGTYKTCEKCICMNCKNNDADICLCFEDKGNCNSKNQETVCCAFYDPKLV